MPKICQPRDVIVQMWYSWDVWDEEVLAGRNCSKCCVFFSIVLWLDDRLPETPKFTPCCGARAIRMSKSLKAESFCGLYEFQARKICTMQWRESDSLKRRGFGALFFNFKSAKFAPRCGTRTVWKPKPLNRQGLGPCFEVETWKCFWVAILTVREWSACVCTCVRRVCSNLARGPRAGFR